MQFLAYTFCRTIEMRLVKWSLIDWQNKVWRVDVHTLKVGKKHLVPLSSQVLDILNSYSPSLGIRIMCFTI